MTDSAKDEKLTTTTKKLCPECGSTNIVWSGKSWGTGSGQPMRDPDRFTFHCEDCNAEFIYTGKMNYDGKG